MRRLALLLAALALVAGTAACGGGEDETATPETVEGTLPEAGPSEGDAENGKSLYAEQGCGGCHTFEAGASNATVGPNLDESTVDFDAAVQQISNGGGGMPSYKDRGLSDEQIADLAAFVTEERSG